MPQPRKRSEKSAETRRRIIDASLQLFVENGYDRTTTRQILQRAGVLNGSLYNLFDSKDQILSEIIVEALDDALNESERYLPEDSPAVSTMCFPVCLLIYASSRNERVAELFATACGRWETRRRVTGAIVDWMKDRGIDDRIPLEASDSRIRMYAVMGALGTILECFEREPGSMDDFDAICVISEIMISTFGLSTMNLKERVAEVYEVVSTRDIVVCGQHISPERSEDQSLRAFYHRDGH